MGILARVRTLLASNLNAAISAAEDPEKMLEQIVRDMQEHHAEARTQVAAAMADEQRLKRQWEAEAAKATEWEGKARKALAAGDEKLARDILVRKAEHDKTAAGYKGEFDKQAAAVKELKDALDQLNARIEEAKRKKGLLIARAKRAEASKAVHDTLSGIGADSGMDTFARMEGKVDQIEAEAAAAEQMADHASGDDLEKRVAALAPSPDDVVEQEMARLKAEIAAPKPPAA